MGVMTNRRTCSVCAHCMQCLWGWPGVFVCCCLRHAREPPLFLVDCTSDSRATETHVCRACSCIGCGGQRACGVPFLDCAAATGQGRGRGSPHTTAPAAGACRPCLRDRRFACLLPRRPPLSFSCCIACGSRVCGGWACAARDAVCVAASASPPLSLLPLVCLDTLSAGNALSCLCVHCRANCHSVYAN
jgi:hypothetical protein